MDVWWLACVGTKNKLIRVKEEKAFTHKSANRENGEPYTYEKVAMHGFVCVCVYWSLLGTNEQIKEIEIKQNEECSKKNPFEHKQTKASAWMCVGVCVLKQSNRSNTPDELSRVRWEREWEMVAIDSVLLFCCRCHLIRCTLSSIYRIAIIIMCVSENATHLWREIDDRIYTWFHFPSNNRCIPVLIDGSYVHIVLCANSEWDYDVDCIMCSVQTYSFACRLKLYASSIGALMQIKLSNSHTATVEIHGVFMSLNVSLNNNKL